MNSVPNPFTAVSLNNDVRIEWNPDFIERMITRRRARIESHDRIIQILQERRNIPATVAALNALQSSLQVDRIVASTITCQIFQNTNKDSTKLGITARDDEDRLHQQRLKDAVDNASTGAREQANNTLAQYQAGQARLSPSIAGTLRETALHLRHLARPAGEGHACLTTEDITRLLTATGATDAAD